MSQISNWLHAQTMGDVPARPGKTLVEITGQERVIIENHKGIRHYSDEMILVDVSYGGLEISGKGLHLCCMGKDQMCISGRVDAITFTGR